MELKKIGANATEIDLGNGTKILYSWETPVAAFIKGQGYVRTDRFYSRTAFRQIEQWLDGKPCEIVRQSRIDAIAKGFAPETGELSPRLCGCTWAGSEYCADPEITTS